jgi:hypothetical protein
LARFVEQTSMMMASIHGEVAEMRVAAGKAREFK